MIIISKSDPLIKMCISDLNRIEGAALQQLRKTATLPGMKGVVGMPDLHPGKGGPIGAAFITQNVLYPFLIGSDIGCGMCLWQTSLRKKKLKRDKWAGKLAGFEDPWDGDAAEWLKRYALKPTLFDTALGTIGGGNHFAELQMIEKVYDADESDRSNPSKMFLLNGDTVVMYCY